MSQETDPLQTGQLSGHVIDDVGLTDLPGVTIILDASEPSIPLQELTTVSDASGWYRLLVLYPGTYKLTAELKEFETAVYPDVVIRSGHTTTVDIRMSPATKR